MIVLEATSGMNLPLKVGPMLSLADMAVVTKIDRVSQAEREVFRARIQDVAPGVMIREVNALHGIGIDPLVAGVLDVRGRFGHALASRQSAGGHLHDLRGQEGDRLAVALRRGPGPGKPDVLPGRVARAAADLLRQRRHHAARPRGLGGHGAVPAAVLGQSGQPLCRGAAGPRGASMGPGGQVAALLGAEPGEIVFTSGGTEADNLALQGVLMAAGPAASHLVASAIEHPAVLACCQQLERLGVAVTRLRVDDQGLVDPADLEAALQPEHAAGLDHDGQ